MPPNATNPAAFGARTGLGLFLAGGWNVPRDSLSQAKNQHRLAPMAGDRRLCCPRPIAKFASGCGRPA